MELFTVTVLGRGNFINASRGWFFSSPSRASMARFSVQDIEDQPRFFNIQSLQPIGDGIVADGFYKKQFSALAADEHSKTNEDFVLVAIVVEEGYIDIPTTCFKRNMVKSPIIKSGNMSMVVVHFHKSQHMSFRVKDGRDVVSDLVIRYSLDHRAVEVHDYSKGVIVSSYVDSSPQNLIVRLLRSLQRFNPLGPRAVR